VPGTRDCLVGLLLCGSAAVFVGCAEPRVREAHIGCYAAPRNEILQLRRVGFVELASEQNEAETDEQMTEALFRAIQARHLFHVDVIRRTDPACRDLPLDGKGPYTVRQLAELHRALGYGALLYGWVSDDQPYPRMQLGLHLRLLDLEKGKLLWGIDNIWDTTDRQTELRIQDFFQEEMRTGYDPLQWRLATVSPSVFKKFIAYEITETLPTKMPCDESAKAPKKTGLERTLRKVPDCLGKL